MFRICIFCGFMEVVIKIVVEECFILLFNNLVRVVLLGRNVEIGILWLKFIIYIRVIYRYFVLIRKFYFMRIKIDLSRW